MTDVNTPLIKAYYDALKVLPYKVYEGEEPDNIQDQVYLVISDVFNRETSTKNSSDTNSTIQIGIYSWEHKYNTAKTVNTVAAAVYSVLKPEPNTTLSLAASGMQLLNMRVIVDRTERIGELAGRKYINRIIVFQQDIFIFT